MSTINAGQSLQRFTQDKWYAYSGVVQGDVSVPATITLIDIPNSGLKNGFIKIQPCYGNAVSTSVGNQLGIEVKIDGVSVFDAQAHYPYGDRDNFELFVPKQSRLEVISLNTSNNNNQKRGVTVLGWYV
jgi:hypothetical protein